MINFHLPDFCAFQHLNYTLASMIDKKPEWFYDNIHISTIYGTFPGAIWNGGRIVLGNANFPDMKAVINDFNSVGIAVRYTFTNTLLEEKHLHDTYCHLMMEAANNGMNEILVNSPLLEEYLRKEYPNFKYIASTTKCVREIDVLNDFTKKYDMVVTDFRDNKNFEFLDALEDKSKIELLCNPYCSPTCQCRAAHYDYMSQQQLAFSRGGDFNCPTHGDQLDFFDIMKFNTAIKNNEIYEVFNPMGFENFKIEGRTLHVLQVVESYAYYLAKPEYRDRVRFELLKIVW